MRELEWRERDSALLPAGVVAMGAFARRLLTHIRERGESSWSSLSVIATRGTLILIGRNEDLPWIDGARYCAPDPAAPQLWVPTNCALKLPSDLVQSNLTGRIARYPLLLWNEPEFVLPIDQAGNVNVATIDWLLRELD